MKKDYLDEELMDLLDLKSDEDDLYSGNGYSGISMSNNAVEAYEEGRMPLSKWKKGLLIEKIDENKNLIKCDYKLLTSQPVEVLKKLLLSSGGEYHHMGIRYTVVDFYHFDTDRLSELTDDYIRTKHNEYLTEKKQKEIRKQQDATENAQYDGRWKAEYLLRSMDGRRKNVFELTGEVKGGWFYIDPGSGLQGKKKLSITGKDFSLMDRLD